MTPVGTSGFVCVCVYVWEAREGPCLLKALRTYGHQLQGQYHDRTNPALIMDNSAISPLYECVIIRALYSSASRVSPEKEGMVKSVTVWGGIRRNTGRVSLQ